MYCVFEGDDDTNSEGSNTSAETGRLLQSYILGDVLQDHSYCNAIINALIERVKEKETYPTHLASQGYDKLPKSSPFRTLIVDFWVWIGSMNDWHEHGYSDSQCGPKEFWEDVAIATWKAGKQLYGDDELNYPWVMDRCRYHGHPDGEERCN